MENSKTSETGTATNMLRYAGPPLGILAVIYMVLFIAGLYPVTIFGGKPYFPGPWESADVIAAFFQARPFSVILCAFFQFGAAISLGVFTASITSQLRFLGARFAGTYIAYLGGLITALNMICSVFILWVMAHPGIAKDTTLLNALYYLSYVFGGPGFSVPLGLLIAGISIVSAFMKLLPKWIVVFGIILAVIGELSWLNLIFPQALFLIPLTRFPAFVWLIIVGFILPKAIPAKL
ncbi:MAG TPA: hypothetical protein VNZ45_07610 [Bacteroidia bacterium]|jgi:hypothetical protein|nr:hypothetical protein [Bacteroidia bacterium]